MHHRQRETLAAAGLLLVSIGLLVPLFERATAKARSSDCGSNVKQLALSLRLYAADYDATLPATWLDVDGSGDYQPNGDGDVVWAAALYPEHLPNPMLLLCCESAVRHPWDGRPAPSSGEYGLGYGYNSRLAEVDGKLAAMPYPEATVMVFDLTPDVGEPWAGLPDDGNDPTPGAIGNIEERVRANHEGEAVAWRAAGEVDTGRAMVGYVDGHVKAERMGPLLTTGAGAAGNRWAPRR